MRSPTSWSGFIILSSRGEDIPGRAIHVVVYNTARVLSYPHPGASPFFGREGSGEGVANQKTNVDGWAQK
jgi:hypothetical protein